MAALQGRDLRLGFIDGRSTLAGKTVIDVGCGGGLLAEAMAACGARVTGIDLAESSLTVARLHLLESGRQVDYRYISAEDLAAEIPGQADVVTCMELLEHVPDPASVIRACAALLKPGGRLFLSTLNRTPLAFGAAILGAEHVLRLLPRGTHRYDRFLKPSEVAADLRAAGLVLDDLSGIAYNPLTRRARLVRGVAVNYLACASKPA